MASSPSATVSSSARDAVPGSAPVQCGLLRMPGGCTWATLHPNARPQDSPARTCGHSRGRLRRSGGCGRPEGAGGGPNAPDGRARSREGGLTDADIHTTTVYRGPGS